MPIENNTPPLKTIKEVKPNTFIFEKKDSLPGPLCDDMIERFEKQRLPRILDIKKMVDRGEVLSKLDIKFLEEVFHDTQQYKQFVDEHPAPGYILIGLSVATGQARAELTRLTTEQLEQRTYLQLKESGRRIYLERYENPNEVGGSEAYLYFPRTEDGQDPFKVEEKELRFNCEINRNTWINMPFKLEKMVFNGELEI